ncbi:MAG: S46 family peptidase [Bacteroidales bacterium]|nr:S46 family peptidase [Bacteroidales bacterium]
MKRIISASLIFIALLFSANLWADEGMWMIHTAKPAVQAMSKAVVAIDFMGTGSFVSEDGLVITNHHVAYADVFALGTKEHNWLEEGFWARSREEELPVKGRNVQLLKETIDVTAEVQALIADGTVRPGAMMSRKLSWIMEKRYSEKTGLEAILSGVWRGTQYFISLYEQYRDVRLVAAPPVCLAAFGGDVDNWEWPQHKCDFAIYRVYSGPDGKPADYSPENIPLKTSAHLKICSKGIKEGDATIIIGFPGRTSRYASSARVNYLTETELPIVSSLRAKQMEIISGWMDKDPEVRRKYADYYFGLSNFQELALGQMQCNKRFGVVEKKQEEESRLQEWIDADPARKEKWGAMLGQISGKYEAVRRAQEDVIWYRECISRGTRIHPVASRSAALKRKADSASVVRNIRADKRNLDEIDMRVERDLFRLSLENYYEHITPEMLGPYQKEIRERFGTDYDAMCVYLWDGSWFADSARMARFLIPKERLAHLDEFLSDPLVRFFGDAKIVDFNNKVTRIQGKPSLNDLSEEYTHALYAFREDSGIAQYPDANSTMRANFGHVKGYSREDGLDCRWYTTMEGMRAKHNPDVHDFCLIPGWKAVADTAPATLKVDFLTDNDSTGGNSGSPVLNKKGELIGLLFDGVKESLATDFYFTKDYNRSVCVDIRYVMWVLKNYGRMDAVLSEMGVK